MIVALAILALALLAVLLAAALGLALVLAEPDPLEAP